MSEQRNLVLAIILSILIILGFQLLYEAPRNERRQQAQRQDAAADASGPQEQVPPQSLSRSPHVSRDRGTIIADGQRLKVSTPNLHGSVPLIGGRIDDLTLANYHVSPDPSSADVILLSPAGVADAWYAEFGWVAASGGTVTVPGPETEWTTGPNQTLAPGSPITLHWDNGQGLIFGRTLAVDNDFMITVTQTVTNNSPNPVTLTPYGLISRQGTPVTSGYYILHEGPLGVFGGRLIEKNYADLKEKTLQEYKSDGGWIGITDKYWLVSISGDKEANAITGRFRYAGNEAFGDRYQVDMTFSPISINPGQIETHNQLAFIGAKKLSLLDFYGEKYGITNFDLAIDFGWFWFLTKPFFHALNFIGNYFNNFGIAILIFTLFVKAAFFPLANRSYQSMSKMKALQPQMKDLQEKYKDDRVQMQQELMALYKREKVNPVSGCLPMIIQIPVFFALYKVLFVTIEMRHAPFFGWIRDLSSPEPTSFINLFGLLPFDPPGLFMHLGVFPIVMGLTMFLQQRLNPQPPDPVQQKVFMVLPIVFTYMLASFPVGLVIYWSWNNSLSIIQQWLIMRRMGVKIS